MIGSQPTAYSTRARERYENNANVFVSAFFKGLGSQLVQLREVLEIKCNF
jgi:hypothetical protein